MWKLAIIDDEKMIVEGLQVLVDWSDLGIEIVCATTDPTVILDQYQNFDMLLSDVQMPVMTGIELVKQIKNKKPELECLFLSGYDDFSYAQQGMQVGVSKYLLKPVNEAEIVKTFQVVIEKVAKKYEQNRLIKQQQYEQLKRGQLVDQMPYSNLFEQSEAFYLFSAGEFGAVSSTEQFQVVWLFEVPKAIGVCFFKRENMQAAKAHLYEQPIQVLSPHGQGINDVVSCFKSLHEVVILHEQQTILLEEFQSVQLDFTMALQWIEKLHHVLLQDDFEMTHQLIVHMFKEQYSKNDFDDLLLLVILAIQQFCVSHHLVWENMQVQTVHEMHMVVSSSATGQQAVEQLLVWLQDIHTIFHAKVTSYPPIIHRVVQIIDQTYQQDISLKTLSQEVNMNSSYLGQIFKEEIGVNFNAYVNQIRMEKAQELLLHSHLKINQIAAEVGFQDNSYFYRKFKTYYGYCPNTVRKKQIDV